MRYISQVLIVGLFFFHQTDRPLGADDATVQPADADSRRIYVPVDQLDVLFERDGQGVILPRQEFLKLQKAAEQRVAERGGRPGDLIVTDAAYVARIDGEQLAITARLEFEKFDGGWQTLPLALGNLAVERAQIDGEPALLGRSDPQGKQRVLFVRNAGKHVLELELSTNLAPVAGDHAATFEVPVLPSARLEVTVPASKFLYFNEAEPERGAALDQPATYSFPLGGRKQVSLRVSDRRGSNANQGLLFATTLMGVHVEPDELTWQTRTTLQVFGKPVDQLEFEIPNSLEIVSVTSTGLERWDIVPGGEDGPAKLTLHYRQPFQDSRDVRIKGVRSATLGESWKVSTLRLQQAATHLVRVVIQHSRQLRAQVVSSVRVRQVRELEETELIDPSLVPSTPDGGEQTGRFDFVAWRDDFSLELVARPKESELLATLATRIDIDATEISLRSSVIAISRSSPLFELTLLLPAEWSVAEVLWEKMAIEWHVDNGQPGENEPGQNLVRIPINPAAPAGTPVALTVVARRIPSEAWPVEDTPLVMKLPEVRLPQAAVTEGTYMIAAEQDFELTPEQITGLDPGRLKSNPQTDPAGADAPRLVYEYQDTRFQGDLKISRKPARLVARTLSWHRLTQDTLASHIEAELATTGSGVRSLRVALPASVGENAQFQLLQGDARITEQPSAANEQGERVWTLRFDRRVQGKLRVSVDLESPRDREAKSFRLPELTVLDAERQEGFLAIEASSEQQLTIVANDAGNRPLKEMDAVDLPASLAYVPRERVVAAYRVLGARPVVTLDETRFERVAVPTAVCDTAELTTLVGEDGELQHKSLFKLRAVGVQGLLLQLPEGAQLWSVSIDGVPVEVRRTSSADRFQVPLAAANPPESPRTLSLHYRTMNGALAASGTLDQQPPQLSAVSGQGTTQPLEILERSWTLLYPPEERVVATTGVFEPAWDLEGSGWLARLKEQFRLGSPEELLQKVLVLFPAVCILACGLLAYRRWGCLGGTAVLGVLSLGAVALVFVNVTSLGVGSKSAGEATPSPVTAQAPMADSYWSEERYDKVPILESDRQREPATFGQPMPTNEDGRRTLDLKWKNNAEGLVKPFAYGAQGTIDDRTAKDAAARHGVPPFGKGAVGRGGGAAGAGASFNSTNGVPQFGGVAGLAPIDGDQPAAEAAPMEVAQAQPAAPPAPAPQVAPPANEKDQPAAEDPGQPVTVKPGAPPATSGRLSLTIDLQPPSGYQRLQLLYAGTPAADVEPGLHVQFRNGLSVRFAKIALEICILILFWLLRDSTPRVRVLVVVLGLALPIGMAPLASLWYATFLDDILSGVLWGCGLWLVLAAVDVLRGTAARRVFGTAAARLILIGAGCSSAVAASTVWGDEPAPAAQKSLPAPASVEEIIFPYESPADPLAANRVLLPYPKFVELWNKAYPEKRLGSALPALLRKAGDEQGAFVVEALYSARVVAAAKDEAAHVAVDGRIVLFQTSEEAVTRTLPLAGVALTSAELDGQPAPVSSDQGEEQNPRLAVTLSAPGLHVLDLKFRLPVVQTGAAGKVRFSLQPVPAGTLRFVLPGADLAVQVEGAGARGVYRRQQVGDDSVVVLPIAEGGEINVHWFPAKARVDAAALTFADVVSVVTLEETGIRLKSGIRFTVKQGDVSRVDFKLPARWLLRSVEGTEVAGWETAGEGDEQTVQVAFRRPIADGTDVNIELFRPQEFGEEAAAAAIPDLGLQGVTRVIGQVAVYAPGYLKVSAGSIAGLMQINPQQFQSQERRVETPAGDANLAYRLTGTQQLQLNVSRDRAMLSAVAEHAVLVTQRKLRMTSHLKFTVGGAPRSELIVQLPPGFLLYEVTSPDVADYYFADNPANGDAQSAPRLVLDLARPATGSLDVVLTGVVPHEPTDLAPEIRVAAPVEAESLRSTLLVWLDRTYTGTVSESAGWKFLSPADASPALRNARSTPAQFGFSSTEKAPPALGLTLARATPVLSADSLTAVIVEEAVVSYVVSLQWRIAQAAEQRFEFTTPADLEGRLDFSGNTSGSRIREVLTQKIAGNRLLWTVVLDDLQSERFFLTARAMLPLPKGKLEAPSIAFERQIGEGGQTEKLATQHHYLILVNQSTQRLDRGAAAGVKTVNPQDLPIQIGQDLVDQAAEILEVGAQPVTWNLQSLDALRSLGASVNLAEIVLVLARDGSWREQVQFRINNRSRQFLALRLPPGAAVLSLLVADAPARPVHTRRKDQDLLLIALPKTATGDLSTNVKLVLEGRLDTPLPQGTRVLSTKVDLPAPQVVSQADDTEFGIPVARTLWTVYLPNGIDAKAIADPDRTNLTPTDDNYERAVSQLMELLDLSQIANQSSVGSYRSRASFNFKELSRKVDAAAAQSYSGLNEQQENELKGLYSKYQAAQQELYQAEVTEIRDIDLGSRSKGRESYEQDSRQVFELERSLQTRNPSGVVAGDKGEDDLKIVVPSFRSPGKKDGAELKGGAQQHRIEDGRKKAKDDEAPRQSQRAQLRSQSEAQAQQLNVDRLAKSMQPDDKPEEEVAGKDARERDRAGELEKLRAGPVAFGGPPPAVDGPGPGDLPGKLRGQVGAAAGWTSAGGLSLAIEIPKGAQKMTLSKVGGEPKLALAMRPHELQETAFGLAWLFVWVLAALAVAAAIQRSMSGRRQSAAIPVALCLLGIVWYFLLPLAPLGLVFILIGEVLWFRSASRKWGEGALDA